MGLTSEIFLASCNIEGKQWIEFIKSISNYQGIFKKWKLTIAIYNNEIRYYVKTKYTLPSTIHNLSDFILKQSEEIKIESPIYSLPIFMIENKLIDIVEYFEIKKRKKLKYVEIEFCKLSNTKIRSKVYFYLEKDNILYRHRNLFSNPASILTLNLEKNARFFYKSIPKYLDIQKILHLLQSEPTSSLVKVNTFPYLQGDFYLKLNSYEFHKHSLILGASGAGKSKFISLFIHNIYKNIEFRNQYKIVIIDPHAALENDIGGIGKIIDFKSNFNSINLFHNNQNDTISSTELLLELFKSLIADQYNSKLERVLRHSIHLLLSSNNFTFHTLRKVLLDTEYRTLLLKQQEKNLPNSVTDFFLSDFNDLKTKSYSEAISPIISFIDEMEMIPVFNQEKNDFSLKETIQDNFLTIFSLDKTKLGDKSVKTISGLIMQQLLTLVQSYAFSEHIIFIVDEVAVVENPILSRFLSEARKYNLSLILASQYFNQVSDSLKDSIFANIVNYYLFRVSRTDASLLVNHLPMKVPLEDTVEAKTKILTELNNRECVIRINANGILLPAFKAQTMDFESIPRLKEKNVESSIFSPFQKDEKKVEFSIGNTTSLKDILITHSSQRGGIKNE